MAYYDLISEKEVTLSNAIYRIVASISFIPYIFIILLFIFTTSKIKYFSYLKINLLIACIMHDISYLFPAMSQTASASNSLLCLIQSLLNSLSDLASISIALSIVIFTYITFTKTNYIDKHGTVFICLTFFHCWIIPLALCVCIFYFGDVKSNGSTFCWVSNEIVLFCYFGIIIVYYIIFYSCLYVILKKSSQQSKKIIRHLISLFSIVPSLTFTIMSINFSLSILFKFASIPGQIHFILILIAQIGEMLSCPLYVLVYSLDRTLLKEFYCKICHKKVQDNVKERNTEFNILIEDYIYVDTSNIS